MAASQGYNGRIPQFRFKIGSIEDILTTNDATKSVPSNEYAAGDLFNAKSAQQGNIAYCSELGVITINPVTIVENTFLSNKLVTSPDEANLTANKNLARKSIKAKHGYSATGNSAGVTLNDNYFTSYWKPAKRFRTFYQDATGLCVYENTDLSDIYSGYYENVTSEPSGHACRIRDDRVVAGVNKYSALEYDNAKNVAYTANMGMIFEFKINNSTVIDWGVSCARIRQDSYGNYFKESGQSVTITDKHICIIIGMNTNYIKYLLLQENVPPVFITEYVTKTGNGYYVTYGTGNVSFPLNETFYVSITPYINNLIIDFNKSKFKVPVDYQPNFSKSNDYMGKGVKVNLCGFNEFSFGFGKTKYNATKELNNYTNPSAVLSCENSLRTQQYVSPQPKVTVATVYGDATQSSYNIITNEVTTDVNGKAWNTSLSNKYTWDLYMYTLNPFITPYLYKVKLGQDVYAIAPTNTATWQSNVLVNSINITTSAEGLYKAKKTGSITFSNRNTYIDGLTLISSVTDPPKVDWATGNNQKAIKIQFTYLTIPPGVDPPGFTEIQETDWQDLFTGFITNPKISKDSYGNSLVTYDLVDRWMQIEECKVTWNRIYDGVNMITALLDCLREAGIYAPKTYATYALNPTVYDVVISSDTLVNQYVLPLVPNALLNPSYKPKLRNAVEAFLDTLFELGQFVVYFDASGKFNIKHLREVVGTAALNKYVFFSDTISADAECPNNPLMLMPPWNNIKAPNFNRNVRTGIYNMVMVFGPNEKSDNKFPVDWEIVNNLDSMHNPAAENYIGYKKILFQAMLAYGNKQIRQYMAKQYLAEASYPQEDYTWESFGNLLPIFTYVKFKEYNISTGVNQYAYYYLIKNNFSYNSSDLSCKSEMQAKRLKGLAQIYGII